MKTLGIEAKSHRTTCGDSVLHVAAGAAMVVHAHNIHGEIRLSDSGL